MISVSAGARVQPFSQLGALCKPQTKGDGEFIRWDSESGVRNILNQGLCVLHEHNRSVSLDLTTLIIK